MQTAATSLKQRVIRYLVRQAHHPRGIVGWANGWMFAHRPSNRQRNIWAVRLLDTLQPGIAGRERPWAVWWASTSGVGMRR